MVLLAIACVETSSDPSRPVVACRQDADCDDGNPCTGTETCSLGSCQAGVAVTCEGSDICVVEGARGRCETLCPLPAGPAIDVLRDDETLSLGRGSTVDAFAWPASETAPDPIPWAPTSLLDLGGHHGMTRVVARELDASCLPDAPADWFDHTYDVQGAYPTLDAPGSVPPIAMDDPRIVGWGDRVVTFWPGEEVADAWLQPWHALGPAEGDHTSVLPLGRGGEVTIALDPPAADGDGPDLAVFENGFSERFLELGRLEVSTDGVTFASFSGVSRTPAPVGPFEAIDPADVHGFAGVWPAGLGSPFDLTLLRSHPLVRAGQIDLQHIRYVRVVDIVGDGSDADAMGRPIHDPWPTTDSAGFDLDAIAVLSAR